MPAATPPADASAPPAQGEEGYYKAIATDEHHFNSLETELASAWLLAAPLWVMWRSRNLETYAEIGEGFGDADSTEFLRTEDYERLLRGH